MGHGRDKGCIIMGMSTKAITTILPATIIMGPIIMGTPMMMASSAPARSVEGPTRRDKIRKPIEDDALAVGDVIA